MRNIQISNGTVVTDDRVIINGVELPPCPAKGCCTTIINNKVYIGGYEFVNGKWKRTLRGLWHLWF